MEAGWRACMKHEQKGAMGGIIGFVSPREHFSLKMRANQRERKSPLQKRPLLLHDQKREKEGRDHAISGNSVKE